MPGRTPEETDRLMTEAISSGDVEAVVALFEPDGVMLPELEKRGDTMPSARPFGAWFL